MTIARWPVYSLCGGAVSAQFLELGGAPAAMTVRKTKAFVDPFGQELYSIMRSGDSDVIVMGLGTPGDATIHMSTDGGDNWFDATSMLPGSNPELYQRPKMGDGLIAMVKFGGYAKLMTFDGSGFSILMDWELWFPLHNETNRITAPTSAKNSPIYVGTSTTGYIYEGTTETQLPKFGAAFNAAPIVGWRGWWIASASPPNPSWIFTDHNGSYKFDFPALATVDPYANSMGTDETGALWLAIDIADGVSGTCIYRQDPDTGILSLHTTDVVGLGLGVGGVGSLTVAHSKDILVCLLSYVCRWDGTQWHVYSWTSLGLPDGSRQQGVVHYPTQIEPPRTINVGRTYGVNPGDGWLIAPGSPGDYEINTDKTLRRDRTVQTRCFLRLATRKGSYSIDPEFGSTLHLIQITKDSDQQVRDAVTDALEPMIDDGSILSIVIEVDSVPESIDELNVIKARVSVMVPGVTETETITVGDFPIGAG